MRIVKQQDIYKQATMNDSHLEVLYEGRPESFVMSPTTYASSTDVYPGMVAQTDIDGTVTLASGTGGGFVGLFGLYKTADISDHEATAQTTVWTQGGRYLIHSPAFNEYSGNAWTPLVDTYGNSLLLYATASGSQQAKLEPGGSNETRKPVAKLLSYNTTSIEIELLPSA